MGRRNSAGPAGPTVSALLALPGCACGAAVSVRVSPCLFVCGEPAARKTDLREKLHLQEDSLTAPRRRCRPEQANR